jgi:hypothetical protein
MELHDTRVDLVRHVGGEDVEPVHSNISYGEALDYMRATPDPDNYDIVSRETQRFMSWVL